MASLPVACRLSTRLAAGGVRRKVGLRDFSSGTPRWAAQNFVMPAMSPTMTEGNIAGWKVQEGDSFSTGDVLLEIETDKAQMDVEAQDDGIVAKITQQDGSKSVKVGTRIAILAEVGDDINTLEMPAEDPPNASPASQKASSESKEQSPSESEPRRQPKEEQPTKSSPSSKSETAASTEQHRPDQSYPLYPSVQHLLHTNGMSTEESSKIPATGPSGRLLKGDVLSYLGAIDKSYAADLSKKLEKMSHLDLSNIKKIQSKPKEEAAAKEEQKEETVAKETQVALPISLAAVFSTQRKIKESLGLTLPLSTFIARASEIANENLPKAKGAPDTNELFDALLGLDSTAKRFNRGHYIPQITALPPAAPAAPGLAPIQRGRRKEADIMDILTGQKSKPALSAARPNLDTIGVAKGAAGANNVFSVAVGRGEEKRARVYLERMKSVLEAEPGRCVL